MRKKEAEWKYLKEERGRHWWVCTECNHKTSTKSKSLSPKYAGLETCPKCLCKMTK